MENLKKMLFVCLLYLLIGVNVFAASADTPRETVTPELTEPPEGTVTPIPPEEPTITPAPAPLKGLVKENGKYRFYKDSGELLKKKWKRLDGRKYYFNKYGNAAIGSTKIEGQYYVFNNKGQLLEPRKLKIVSITSGKYCVDSKGRPRKGWQIIKKKLYYVNGKGEILCSASRQGITLTKDGSAKDDTNAKLKIKAMQVLDAITTSKMSQKEKLRKCFSYTIGPTFRYNRAKWPNFTEKTWWKKCALDMLNEKQGVCFGYACAFAALAEELGYKPYLVDANLPSRHCFVQIDGRFYDRLTNSFDVPAYPRSYTVNRIIKF